MARCGTTYFVTVLAAGFDAVVNERANAMTWPRGPMRYNVATLAELRRLWRVAHQRYVPFQQASPSRSRPAGVTDRNELDRLCNEYAAAWNARHPE